MLESLRSLITNWLDPIGTVMGLALAVPVIWTWYDVVFGRRRRHRLWFTETRRQPGQRPAVLIIDLLSGKDVLAQVETHIATTPELAAIPKDRRFHLHRTARLKPEDMPGLADEIRQRAAEIARAGCETVHCFYAGPNAASALIGAEFANGARVLLYQYNQGRYENWGPIRHDATT